MSITSSARQITNALANMPVSNSTKFGNIHVTDDLRQLIDTATDDALISDLISSTVSSKDEKPKGRVNHNFGASKSRDELHQFLRRNPHYLPHSKTVPDIPNRRQSAFDNEYIFRFGAKNRFADAYKQDINGTKPRKL